MVKGICERKLVEKETAIFRSRETRRKGRAEMNDHRMREKIRYFIIERRGNKIMPKIIAQIF